MTAAGDGEPGADVRQLCTFMVDGVLFGVDVAHVQEVILHQEMTPVPLAPAVVSGLINLRGQIVTALDLRLRLGLPPRSDGRLPMNIVVRHDNHVVSLMVDEIGDVIEVDSSTAAEPPETLSGVAKQLIQGVYRLSPQLLLVLDSRLASQIDADPRQGRE
jgi:purine-binding chemotaxis protein CheW